MKIYGVTGSRSGATPHQRALLRRLLRDADSLHHGDCVGADDIADLIAREELVPFVYIYPPSDEKLRAFCQLRGAPRFVTRTIVAEPKPYLERNRDIVGVLLHGGGELIAVPDGPERRRSGTWSTVRYARKVGVRVTVLDP